MRFTPEQLRWKYISHDPHLVVGLFLAIIGAGLSAGALSAFVVEIRYRSFGVTVEARVLNKSRAALQTPAVAASSVLAHGGRRRGTRYDVSFEFRDEAGQVHQGTASLGRGEWERLQPGDPLAVIYLRTDPSVHRPARPAWGTIGVGFAMGVIGGLMCFGGVALVLRRVDAINGQVRLVTTGQPVLGLIDAVREVKGSKGSVTYTLTYRYLFGAGGPSARVRNGTCDRPSWRAPSWQPGGPILILADPDDPDRHAVDLFDARPDDLARLCRAPGPA